MRFPTVSPPSKASGAATSTPAPGPKLVDSSAHSLTTNHEEVDSNTMAPRTKHAILLQFKLRIGILSTEDKVILAILYSPQLTNLSMKSHVHMPQALLYFS
jgi:hypothetical protein